jgi:hypothetical protein
LLVRSKQPSNSLQIIAGNSLQIIVATLCNKYPALKKAHEFQAGVSVVVIDTNEDGAPLGCVYSEFELLATREDPIDGVNFRIQVADECKALVRSVKQAVKCDWDLSDKSWWVADKFRVVAIRADRPKIKAAADAASASIPGSSASHGKANKKRARPRQEEEEIKPNLDIGANPLMLAIGAKSVCTRIERADFGH